MKPSRLISEATWPIRYYQIKHVLEGLKTPANFLLFSGKKYNEEEEDEVSSGNWVI